MRIILPLVLVVPALAGTVTVDFDSLSTPSGNVTTVPNPWNEDLMTLECLQPNTTNLTTMVIRRYSNNDTGRKSVSAQSAVAQLRLTSQSGNPFTATSIRLFPLVAGASANSTVTFTGIKSAAAGGGSVTTTLNTGNTLTGLVHTFPTNFTELDELTWTVNNNQAGFGYHQFDDITVELQNIITVPETVVISEGSGPMPITLEREDGSGGTLVMSATQSGTAQAVSDYGLSGVNFPHRFSGSSLTASVNFEAYDDAIDEPVESWILTWPTDPSYTLTHPTTTVLIGDTDGSGFPDYVAGHGLTGNDALPDADPNGDGITNIEAYAFRLNPAGPFPGSWRDRLPRFTTHLGGRSTRPAITWELPSPLPNDVRFVVEESETLSGWTSIAQRTGYGLGSLWIGSSSLSISDSGTPRTVIVPGSQSIDSQDRDFLRLDLQYVSGGGGSN